MAGGSSSNGSNMSSAMYSAAADHQSSSSSSNYIASAMEAAAAAGANHHQNHHHHHQNGGWIMPFAATALTSAGVVALSAYLLHKRAMDQYISSNSNADTAAAAADHHHHRQGNPNHPAGAAEISTNPASNAAKPRNYGRGSSSSSSAHAQLRKAQTSKEASGAGASAGTALTMRSMSMTNFAATSKSPAAAGANALYGNMTSGEDDSDDEGELQDDEDDDEDEDHRLDDRNDAGSAAKARDHIDEQQQQAHDQRSSSIINGSGTIASGKAADNHQYAAGNSNGLHNHSNKEVQEESDHSTIQGYTAAPDHQQKILAPSMTMTMQQMTRSLSIAADILRKEPEQETFVRLDVTPIDGPTEEEAEVCVMLQDCLELRKKYVYRERIAPWDHANSSNSTHDNHHHKQQLQLQETIEEEEDEEEEERKGIQQKSRSIQANQVKQQPDKFPFRFKPEPASKHVYRMVDGVVQVFASEEATDEQLFPVLSATEFFTDLHRLLKIVSTGNVRTLCHNRLRLLEQKFSLHLMLNADREFLAQKSAPHRDFYNVRKVDTHIHHSACMNQKHLLQFIKSKLKNEPDEVVIFRDGKHLTLKEVFESLDLTGYDLNVDLLDVHADKNTFHRFDKFNLKYNPCGQSRLREIFLKQENLIQGRFLAELTKEVFQDLEQSKYQMAEYRISVYGRKQSEWDQLASWFVNHELYSRNVVWLIQLPRIYNVYKEMGIINSFQEMLDNVFLPLFEVTVDPNSHPRLHMFLEQVVGFDLVDDESKPERRPTKHMPTPEHWDIVHNPAYAYYAYYVYANLCTLNMLRESKGLKTFKFRPHAGEAGDLDHLAAAFLLTHGIAHGNNLRKSPGLQYLFYLAQIGLAMSPLSNNSLFLDYHRNPFPIFFARGLNVSLSTDDPLQIHLTKEALVEEYSIAAQVWKLSSCDLCEIARNSVYQSGFSHALKSHWIGDNYYKRGPKGNDVHKTNVPRMRIEFRDEVWREELDYVYLGDSPFIDVIDS